MTRLARQTFASLSVPNYRLFFFGMLVSNTGTWMQTVAEGWLVLKLTGSGTAVGLALAAHFVPMLLFGVWGGVVADRFDKRRTLLVSQAALAVVAGVLAVVTVAGVVELWMVFLAAFLGGCATVVDHPTRQSFLSELVGPELLPNAVGLNSAMFNGARLVGPALAGGLIMVAGTGSCFALNAVSYLAVIVALVRMRPAELHRGTGARGRGQARAGLRYVFASRQLRSVLMLVAVVGTFALNFTVLLPLLSRFTFAAGAGTLGLLTSAMGAGSLLGALIAAARGRPTPRLLVGAAAALGLLMLGIAASTNLVATVVLLVLAGGAAITFLSTANSMLQLGSSNEMRGRVMALYLLVFLGSTPIGGPIVGAVAEAMGPRAGFAAGGAASLLGGLAAGAGLLQGRRRLARLRSGEELARPEEPLAA
ncbi:MAG: MFS transporter [Actinobacteria bacterium]|nr:MFS transporter [Actinomycetota bacterium]MBW3650996.1 MFS transporter [Actinomycetota bacterium]